MGDWSVFTGYSNNQGRAACSIREISSCLLDPGNQILLCVRRFGGHEDRVVARDRADHAGPAAAIESQSDALRRTNPGVNDQQVRAGWRDAA
jgi:hypothetical protein